jgi:uncharacterized protein YbaP (TraB family)
MRRQLLAATLLLFLVPPLLAQEAGTTEPPPAATAQAGLGIPDDGIRTEATVVVTGDQPGPGLWLVRKGGNDLWILGTVAPLPAKMQWQSAQLEQVIANAQEVIYAPSLSVNAKVGKLRALTLLPSLLGIKNNPDGKRLSDVLPAATYTRWSAYRDRFLDRDADKLRPAFAANELWKAAIKRSGMSEENLVKDAVAAAVSRHNPKVTLVRETISITDPKAAIRQFKTSQLSDRACLDSTLDRLGQDMELLRGRANAWATGDVAAIRALPLDDQYQACIEAVTESGIGRQLGMNDVAKRLEAQWLSKAEAALASNTTTLAVLPMRELLKPGGIADILKAKGYTVLAPDE